jgi:hypothetical protein
MMIHWGFWDHDCCPCCHQADETTTHLLICPHSGAALTWQLEVDSLKEWLEDSDTHPAIASCIIDTIKDRDLSQRFNAHCEAFCAIATAEQDSIGWQNFVEGKIACSWTALQEDYYIASGSQHSAAVWALGLVTHLLELVHAMWTHWNSILHQHDHQGLKLEKAAKLEAAICAEFELGTENLAH